MCSIGENPSPPPELDHENLLQVSYRFKPAVNPIIRMISEERLQSVIHLLDQTFLVTPPPSEDEETSTALEPGEILSPDKQKIGEPVAVTGIEIDDSITKNLFDYVAMEKRKKICTSQKQKKKKREDKEDNTKKKRCKYIETKNKTVPLQKKTYMSSHDESSSTHSNSSSPKAPQLKKSHTDVSPNKSSARPKSPTFMGNTIMDGRRSGRKSPGYLSPIRRSPRYRRKSPSRYSSAYRSPSPLIGRWSPSRRSHSPLLARWSPRRRSVSGSPGCRSHSDSPRRKSSSRRSTRRKASIRRSPSRRSPTGSPVQRPSSRRSPTGSPVRRPSSHRSPTGSPVRRPSNRRSPTGYPVRRPSSRRSPTGYPVRRPSSRRSPTGSPVRRPSSRRSPAGSPVRRPSSRRSPTGSPVRRPFSRRSPTGSPVRRPSSRRSPTGSPVRRPSSRRSPTGSPVRRPSICRPPSRKSHSSFRRRRTPSESSTHRKSSNDPKRYGSLSPETTSHRKSPINDKFPSQKSLVPSNSERKSASLSRSPDSEVERPNLEQEKDFDKPQKIPKAKPEIRRLPGTSKFCNFTDSDDYSKLLAKEMKKRRLIDYSDDSDEIEEQLSVEKPLLAEKLGAPLEKEAVPEESNALTEDKENSEKLELGKVNPDKIDSDASFPQTKYFKTESMKSESPERKKGILNTYFCKVCQLGLNSELTWQSHISGKKHAKLLKLQSVHEIAKYSIPIATTPAVVSEDIPRHMDPPPGKKHTPVGDIPKLQRAIDDDRDRPMPGLDFLREIVSEKEVNYYCQLCDAPCGMSSVMPHLIGYKHQLRCLREISPECYEENRDRPKKSFDCQLRDRLMGHERKYGRGKISVYREEVDPVAGPCYDQQPGPSWRNNSSIPDIKREMKGDGETEIPINDECLDTSKGDFFCKLCDAHMNNLNMWEAHVRGKRHLKNAKKIPGENISKLKSVKVYQTRSILEDLIDEEARYELIVGLDFIRETQGVNGEIYNCFLCGSCSTNYDIVEHLLLSKHRLRYLEKLVTDGFANAITTITQMELQAPWFRNTLIDDECRKMVEIYGRGKVEVYVSKN